MDLKLFDGESTPDDPALDDVLAWFSAQGDVRARFRVTIRRALDEVIDGGRTGRWSTRQLAKTEKTYIGTKIEILVRDEFGLPPGPPLDTEIAGHPVEIKWSESFGFEIARENVGHLCLVLGGSEDLGRFGVGLVRPLDGDLGAKNQDGKRKLLKVGQRKIRWLVADADLPPNFLAKLDPLDRDAIMALPKGQPRVTELFTRVQRTPIPRLAVVSVACQSDPTRRTRRDKGDRLGSIRVVTGTYRVQREIAAELGVPSLAKDHWVSFPEQEYLEAERRLAARSARPRTSA